MKNYLVYLDCYTEEHINQCRYALLKYLSVYNLTPPVAIGVIVYTNKPAAFEIFHTFFKEMLVIENRNQKHSNSKINLQNIIASYPGNLLFCQPYCYIKKSIEDVFKRIENGGSVLYNENSSGASLKSTQNFGNAPVQSICSHEPSYKSGGQILPASDYFVSYEGVKEVTKLLKIFFNRNEEESVPNLVKRIHYLDAETIQKEVMVCNKTSVFQKLLALVTGKNNIVQRYQNKL